MIYDEVTRRDWYCFRRGEMQEYIRNHGILPEDLRHKLFEWVDTGHSVHDNPWGIIDKTTGLPSDYLEAMEAFYTK